MRNERTFGFLMSRPPPFLSPLNKKNERVYRQVMCKTEISKDNLMLQIEKKTPSIMYYEGVSWHGKAYLFLVECYAEDQENILCHRKIKKTVNQIFYRN